MSSADYKFVPTDTTELEAEMAARYEQLTGQPLRAGSPERLVVEWVASVIVLERVLINYSANQNLPGRAAGANLDALAELFYDTPRPTAQPAVCTERFYISEAQDTAILVPAGTRVTDADAAIVFATEADAYIDPGETHIDLRVLCRTVGTAGNGYAVGSLSTIVDVYDYYSGCSNITESDGGSDMATDEEYRELLRASMDAHSTAGARESYIYHAKQVSSEIADVAANSPSAGTVGIYVLMKDGTIAGEEIKKAVLAACSAETVRPLTDRVFVEDAETVQYDISFTYYIQSDSEKSAAAVEADVRAAVNDYVAWQCGRFGRDINPDKLRDYLYRTGIKRIELTSPDYKVLGDGSGNQPPQLAKVNEITVTNGGYEDE